jgi:hypothetical protein
LTTSLTNSLTIALLAGTALALAFAPVISPPDVFAQDSAGAEAADALANSKHPLAVEFRKANKDRDAYFANQMKYRNNSDVSALASLKRRAVAATARVEEYP